MRSVIRAVVVVAVMVACSTARAQCGCGTPVVVHYGAAGPVLSAPVAVQQGAWRPAAPATEVVAYQPFAAPVVTYRPIAPAPVVTYRPLAPAPWVVYRAPVVTYRPVAPVVTYSPAVYPAPMVYPGAVVRTKVYYPGEPIRNFFKAITP